MTTPYTLDLVGSRQPPLQSGTYTITAHQRVGTLPDDAGRLRIPPTTFAPPPQTIVVTGPRTVLDPAHVAGVFPPRGSTGDHAHVLPHVRLTPAALPWQRSARTPADADPDATQALIRETPWLALLVLDAEEAPPVTTMAASDLGAGDADWWPLAAEPGESEADRVAVIDVRAGLLRRVLPTPEELSLLSHVRERREAGAVVSASAVVLGNRLPARSGGTTVHLVSLEHRVHRSPQWRYRFADLADDEEVRLISLHHWSFTCAEGLASFHGLAGGLDRSPPSLRLPTEDGLRGRVSVDHDGQMLVTHELGIVAEHDGPAAGIEKDEEFGPWIAVDGSAARAVRIPRPFADPDSFTIAAWVRPGPADPVVDVPLVGGLHDGAGVPTMLQSPDGALVLLWSDEEGRAHRADIPDVLARPDTWVHVCWVREGGRQRVAVDGQARAEVPAEGRLPAAMTDLWVGRAGGTAWRGGLADVRVYDRALADAEIAGVHVAPRGVHPELAGAFLSRGLVPVEHHMRPGTRTVSWVRSPLSVDPLASAPEPAPRHADGYLEYHAAVDMWDASLAVAWELGRHVMLRSHATAVALHRWKRQRRQDRHRLEHAARATHLPLTVPTAASLDELPQEVARHLEDLAVLHDVPANHLLPHPQLLPPESMRLVRVDPIWVEAMVRGALTIGDQTSFDRDRSPTPPVLQRISEREVGGFLLRSELVANWPTLVVQADREPIRSTDEPGTAPLTLLRRDEIAHGVLLCLFDGHPATIDLHLAPEEMHCGFERSAAGLGLTLRAPGGAHIPTVLSEIPRRPVSPGSAGGDVIDVTVLQEQLGTLRGAPLSGPDLALQLTTGVPRVRFVMTDARVG